MIDHIRVLKNNHNFTQLLLSSTFINLLSMALPFSMLQIYDRILPNEAYGTANVLLFGVSIAIVLELLLRYARSWFLASSAVNYEYSVTSKLVNRLLKSDFRYLESLGSGKILSGIKNIAVVRDLYSGQAAVAMMDVPFILLFLFLIFYIGGWIVAVPILVWVVAGIWVWVVSRKLLEATKDLAVSDSERTRILVLVLSGLTTVKALAIEARMTHRFKEFNYTQFRLQTEVDLLSSRLQEIVQGASLATTLTIVMVGCLSVLDGSLTTGGLAACSILAGRAVAPLSSIGSLRAKFSSVKVVNQDIENLLSAPLEQFTAEVSYQAKLPLGPVHFEQVSASKEGARLTEINVEIPAGSITTVTSNPMSYASLFLGSIGAFYPVNSGAIKIAGIPLCQHDDFEFRQSVCYVSPWGAIFQGTVMDNMTMFHPENEAYATELSERLGLSETIAKLPYGFQTQIGSSQGQILNKGALKLISLIRALSQQPSILLLDEPMVSLDADSQSKLLTLLNDKRNNMTIIVASYFNEISAISDLKLHIELDGTISIEATQGVNL
ncbi:ATP-binding cassette domain-containing protein [Vibrio fluvialis]|uniref:ABC transporter transmembrane domain-containing protein n=1 Tax=Vibrio fluvialis TaxID=676 RepID=UPI001EFF3246|nr:ABC transporter transmembrane domain-containing protein [Vibrio fluvialis]MCE7611455.1 ATP-binding cassette domain-containing protein [Vibrio fluvialis]MCE7617581.1 ATP-binding cassette domain-containing protein [Vibrio fluvialis]MCE7626632.1 ATP-binding cassette domain-containing protein [Vibrio fluvialis]